MRVLALGLFFGFGLAYADTWLQKGVTYSPYTGTFNSDISSWTLDPAFCDYRVRLAAIEDYPGSIRLNHSLYSSMGDHSKLNRYNYSTKLTDKLQVVEFAIPATEFKKNYFKELFKVV